MHPILAEIGGVSLYTYGFVMMAALFVIYFLALRDIDRSPLTRDQLDDIGLIILGSIWVGGGVVYLLVFGSWDWDNLRRMFDYRNLQRVGTISISSSVALLMWGYCRWQRLPLWRVLDFLLPGFVLGYAIQRLFGCFSAGCCYGMETDLPWAVRFPFTMGVGPTPGVAVHPTQLYLGLTAGLVWLLLRWISKRAVPTGFVTATGLAGLFGFYFAIAFVRGDIPGQPLIWGVRTAMLFSFTIFACSLAAMLWLTWRAVMHTDRERNEVHGHGL